MLVYGIRKITTNPTLITKSKDIVKILDNKTKKARAYVVPAIYEEEIKKFIKDLEYKKWVNNKCFDAKSVLLGVA